MHILSIETSCDETAVSIVEAIGDFPKSSYQVLGNALMSQTDIHAEYGGVFPNLAKREHIKMLPLMLEKALHEADMLAEGTTKSTGHDLDALFSHEDGLADTLRSFFSKYKTPDVDCIAVTSGPGLEPALWAGINFAKALSLVWDVPIVPVNHMEGHVLASVFDGEKLTDIPFPALALLISGGHTELVSMQSWDAYEVIGETRDDAVGEAFDKVARMIGLPYPGGPEISRLAAEAREKDIPVFAELPKPMIGSDDCDFSFSGLKTAVRYAIGEKTLSENEKRALARDFEDAVTEVLLTKTVRGLEETDAHTLILGGGVTANTHIKKTFTDFFEREYPDVVLHFPAPGLATDNSIMIALAGHARYTDRLLPTDAQNIRAEGRRRF